MRFFTLHERPGNGGEVVAVASGFSWAAALVPVLWLLWHRLWAGLGAYVVFSVALGLATEYGQLADPATALIALAVSFLIGCMAADFRRWMLGRHGWHLAGVVMARNAAEAEERWLRDRDNALYTAGSRVTPSAISARPVAGDTFPRLV